MKKNKKLDLRDPALLRYQEGVHTSGVAVKHDEVLPLSEEGLERLQKRKRLELDTIQSLDRTDITPRKECWFLVDSRWLNQWAAFVTDLDNARTEPGTCPVGAINGDLGVPEGEPGPLSTRDLVEQPDEELMMEAANAAAASGASASVASASEAAASESAAVSVDDGSEKDNKDGNHNDVDADGDEDDDGKQFAASAAAPLLANSSSSSSNSAAANARTAKAAAEAKAKVKAAQQTAASGASRHPSTRPYKLLPDLKPVIDYRGVTPEVYYTFVELYGRQPTHPQYNPELTRYVCDADGIDVDDTDLLAIRYGAQLRARANVNELRKQWIPPPPPDEDDAYAPDRPIFCGLTPTHIEAFIYWFVSSGAGAFVAVGNACKTAYYWITCRKPPQGKGTKSGRGRKASGRSDIRYRDYQPLGGRGRRGQEDPDALHSNDSGVGDVEMGRSSRHLGQGSDKHTSEDEEEDGGAERDPYRHYSSMNVDFAFAERNHKVSWLQYFTGRLRGTGGRNGSLSSSEER